MIPNTDAIGALIALQMSSGSTTADICDIFEEQIPISDITVFGDYHAVLVEMPQGVWENVQQTTNTFTHNNVVTNVYLGTQTDQFTTWQWGLYSDDKLLWLYEPIRMYARFQTWQAIFGSDNTFGGSYLSSVSTYIRNLDIEHIEIDKYPNFYMPKIPIYASSSGKYYDQNGNVTSEYTNPETLQGYCSAGIGTANWKYTKLSTNEAIAEMNLLRDAIFADYQQNN